MNISTAVIDPLWQEKVSIVARYCRFCLSDVSVVTGQVGQPRSRRRTADPLSTAVLMPYSTTVSQAEGMLASRFGVSVERAAEFLAGRASDLGEPVGDLAYRLVYDGLHFTQP
jgi:hypothetical protein